MTTRKLTFHTDPGHGWLEVSRADLDALAIADRVYLEEDLDASLYLEAARAAGWTVNIREQHRDPSPIRNLQPYRPTVLALMQGMERAGKLLFVTIK